MSLTLPGLSVLGKQWRLRDDAPFAQPYEQRAFLARLLKLRGVESKEAARAFLEPSLPAPAELPNLEGAVERLARAVRDSERIAIYGDYDADGITGTAVLVEGITALGGRAVPYIPDRFAEGYGLNTDALRLLMEEGASLVVSVDTGTSAWHEVAYANERELDVIVVDHHLPKGPLPDAVAIVNPRLAGAPESHAHLSGCGTAFIVVRALAERLGRPLDALALLDLVAISTVCDVVALTGINRALVSLGLEQIRRRARIGISALIESAGLGEKPITARSLGFQLGPRINAAGRLGHANTAYELLTTRHPDRARELAEQLSAINAERQLLTEEARTACLALAEQECAGAPLIMVGSETVHQGIAGLVAGRLAERYYRPAIVYQIRADGTAVGSARSIPGFNIHDLLARGEGTFMRWGGHPQAGGFTVRTEQLPALRATLTRAAAEMHDWSNAYPILDVDFELPLDARLPREGIDKLLQRLEPCGMENAAPVFLARQVRVLRSTLTRDGKHVQLTLAGERNRPGWRGIAFGLGAHAPHVDASVDLVYQLSEDTWAGGMQVQVKDLRPSLATA